MMGLLASGVMGITAIDSAHAEARVVNVIQDSGADRMVTKVYELKHTLAADILAFVAGAVNREDSTSNVRSLNFSSAGKQIIVVTLLASSVEQIDDLVSKLDRPGLTGTGITNFTYKFKYRDADAEGGHAGDETGGLRNIIDKLMSATDEGHYMSDESKVYFKDSLSDGTKFLNVLQELDQPVPQAEVTIKRYQIFEDDMLDLGINYNQWQNLYKSDWFDYTWSNNSSGNLFNGAFNFYLNSSFLRMANNLNKDVKVTKASIVVRNNMAKGSDGTNVARLSFGDMNIKFKAVNCYQPGNVFRTYVEIEGRDGDTLEYFYTRCKIKTNEEVTLFQFSDEVEAEETVGIPFLMDIPVVKYLFARELSVKRKVYNYITITAKPVTMETNESELLVETMSKTQIN